jgi:hypothetical protein
VTPFAGSLPELLLLLNNAGVTEYADGTITLRLGGTGAKTHEELRKPPKPRNEKPTPEPFDDIALALNGPPPGALDD